MHMLAQLKPTSVAEDRSKRTKITPENVQQIINLVERGKSKEEIADIVGVTTGTLQVTCSKLGVSLRRPRFDTGTGMLGRRRLATASSPGASSQSASRTRADKTEEQPTVESPPMQNTEMLNGSQTSGIDRSASMTLAIKVHYKGKEKTRELPLTPDMIGRVALEAEFRGLGTGELIARLITDAIEKDLVDVVLGER
jgi:transposase-like protein